jgi:hypothetical protein
MNPYSIRYNDWEIPHPPVGGFGMTTLLDHRLGLKRRSASETLAYKKKLLCGSPLLPPVTTRLPCHPERSEGSPNRFVSSIRQKGYCGSPLLPPVTTRLLCHPESSYRGNRPPPIAAQELNIIMESIFHQVFYQPPMDISIFLLIFQ